MKTKKQNNVLLYALRVLIISFGTAAIYQGFTHNQHLPASHETAVPSAQPIVTK